MSRADERSMRAQLRDLSCSGAFIDTDARLPEGTCIALGFYVDDGNTRTAVLAKAAVVRCEPCQARRGVAVRFVRIGSEGRRAIHRVVREQTAAAL